MDERQGLRDNNASPGGVFSVQISASLRGTGAEGGWVWAPRQVMRVPYSFKLEIKAYPGVLS